ncbi:DUF6879 family protein [Streptomyces litchfieldiae]|uniref:DUF6879 domain-containing protein n=1 Tax=Streptomyces litchfieldiae TaxID=3075543 RepID=A0ABU2MPG1_9ACTN|nr:DUF6879 family protein [Streptomyces sp. DSM 44938]MDT0342788.1 hypothetical protein [Streptomyces sp. DSM 44938]
MLDLQPPALDPTRGVRLLRSVYRPDFRSRNAEIQNRDSWKFERRQHFEEQNDPSRDALTRGDWNEALRLLEEERDDIRQAVRADAGRGSVFHRVRIVEEPLTPYVQWELHALRIQAECGRRIRVVRAERVSPLESGGPLPEVVVLGGATLYDIAYTDEGVPDGATRYEDPDVVQGWEAFIARLYADGEDVRSYVERSVAHLPPPQLSMGAGD